MSSSEKTLQLIKQGESLELEFKEVSLVNIIIYKSTNIVPCPTIFME